MKGKKNSQSVAKMQGYANNMMNAEPSSIGGIIKKSSVRENKTAMGIQDDIQLAQELTNSSKIINSAKLYDGDMGAKAMSSVSLPTLGGRRRVHNDGMMMLDNHYNMRETEQKAQIMENRLKRLEAEEARAQRNQKMAEKKA